MQRNPHSYQIATGYRTFYSLSLIYQPITKKRLFLLEKSQCVVNMEEIGKIIKERRKSLKVNQLELSKLAGVGINTLVAIERGEGNPKLETLLSILERPEHRHLL